MKTSTNHRLSCLDVFDHSIEEIVQSFRASEELAVFQHVPKTAGSAVHVELDRIERGFHWLGEDTPENMQAFFEQHRTEPFSLLRGHMKSQHIDQLSEQGFGYRAFTFLRCPIKQTVSHFRYCHSDTAHNHERYRREFPTLESFMTKYLGENFSTRYLIGPVGSVDEALEKIAGRFCFVGLTEYFNTSMFLLSQCLGIEFRVPPRVNITRSHSPVSELLTPEMLEQIQDRYAIDIAVFEFFNSRFGSLAERVVESTFQRAA